MPCLPTWGDWRLGRRMAARGRMTEEIDIELRRAAVGRARQLQHEYTDLIPVGALRRGFVVRGEHVSFGSFYSGIFRPKECRDRGAVSLVTTSPKIGRSAPYEDRFDETTGRFTYRFRDPQSGSREALRLAEADNRALIAAFELGAPLIYFRGIAPGQYLAVCAGVRRSRRFDGAARADGGRSADHGHVAHRSRLRSGHPAVRDQRGALSPSSAAVPGRCASRLRDALRGLSSARGFAAAGVAHHQRPGSPWVGCGGQRNRAVRDPPSRV